MPLYCAGDGCVGSPWRIGQSQGRSLVRQREQARLNYDYSDQNNLNQTQHCNIIIHPDCGYNVVETFECPLVGGHKCPLTDVHESATKGCPYCILIYVAVTELCPWISRDLQWYNPHALFNVFFFEVPGENIPSEYVGWAGTVPIEHSHQLFAYNFYNQPVRKMLVERLVPCDTASTKSLQTAQEWIARCDADHGCTQQSDRKLPRRLLDIGRNSVRLRETMSEDDCVRYVCLSHCWGQPPTAILRTTLSTLTSHKDGIPWNILPRTFQDAINFARKLGIACVWIDSLCIIQDDKRDWEEQSADMANIYRNAYVTFAATASVTADDGCFTRKDRPRFHETGSPLALLQFGDGIEHPLFARRRFNHGRDYHLPLLKRGWVYQERLLSPRVLHFVGEELIWECNITVDCECGNQEDFHRLKNKSTFGHNKLSPRFSIIGTRPFRWWHQVVREYTSLSLTKPSDTFPALSGIARAFSERVDDEYAAGMWKKTLVLDLLWMFCYKKGPKVLHNSARPWRAPSWSWASEDFQPDLRYSSVARWPAEKLTELANVKQFACEPSGADSTGELITAYLTLSAKVIPARLCRILNDNDQEYCIDLHDGNGLLEVTDREFTGYPKLGAGYMDLNDARLASGIESLDILLAEIASCIGKRTVDLESQTHRCTQQVRYYMLLARHEDIILHRDHWVRVGLASIAVYTPTETVRDLNREGDQAQKTEAELAGMPKPEVPMMLEEPKRCRELLRRFDDAETQDFVVY